MKPFDAGFSYLLELPGTVPIPPDGRPCIFEPHNLNSLPQVFLKLIYTQFSTPAPKTRTSTSELTGT